MFWGIDIGVDWATEPDYAVVVSYESHWDEAEDCEFIGFADIEDSNTLGYYSYDFPMEALELPKTERNDYEGNVLSELRPVEDE
jgi:hypothetical protein